MQRVHCHAVCRKATRPSIKFFPISDKVVFISVLSTDVKRKEKVAAGEGVEECGSLHLLLFTPFFFLLSVILSRRRRDCRIPGWLLFIISHLLLLFSLVRPSFVGCLCFFLRPQRRLLLLLHSSGRACDREKVKKKKSESNKKKREREEKKVRSGINNRHKQKWEKAVARKRRVGASFYTTRIGEVFLLLLLRTSVIRGGGDAQCVSARLASLCAST